MSGLGSVRLYTAVTTSLMPMLSHFTASFLPTRNVQNLRGNRTFLLTEAYPLQKKRLTKRVLLVESNELLAAYSNTFPIFAAEKAKTADRFLLINSIWQV